jgi:hypothetical protein
LNTPRYLLWTPWLCTMNTYIILFWTPRPSLQSLIERLILWNKWYKLIWNIIELWDPEFKLIQENYSLHYIYQLESSLVTSPMLIPLGESCFIFVSRRQCLFDRSSDWVMERDSSIEKFIRKLNRENLSTMILSCNRSSLSS